MEDCVCVFTLLISASQVEKTVQIPIKAVSAFWLILGFDVGIKQREPGLCIFTESHQHSFPRTFFFFARLTDIIHTYPSHMILDSNSCTQTFSDPLPSNKLMRNYLMVLDNPGQKIWTAPS